MATLGTPLEYAGDLVSGRRLFIKRDDLTGLGMGGNKARKAEMLCGDALASNCDLLVTVGAAQSNHARVTAAAGARCGVETHLVLGGSTPEHRSGNQLLSQLFGAELHDAGTDSWKALAVTMSELVDGWRASGRRPYVIPMGGSSPVGASAFVLAWHEFRDQLADLPGEVSTVVVTSSTGGTHAGLVAGRALFGGPQILAIDVAKESKDLAGDTVALARSTLKLLGASESVDRGDVVVDGDHIGEGYAIPTEAADAAIRGLGCAGGWVLDRVYTGKGFAGLLAHDAAGTLGDGDVVFWHTGGQPSVFALAGAPPPKRTPPILKQPPRATIMESQ